VSKISMVDYEESMAEAVVRMWHESADGWPPGFNCESKTAEYVADKHRDGDYIHTTLAMDGDRVVGYIRTRQYGGEPDAAYVAFVNVVTDMHGRGIGKRLLLDTIERVSEAGYDRIDLDTWPGNLKAVPLYKKTGFLWVPDRDVHMENYLPLLLRRPEVKRLLGDGYWYDHLCHDGLETKPDLHETGSGRRVFTYRFERDNEALEAEVDLAGRCLSGWSDGRRSFRLSRGGGKLVFGRPVDVRLEGTALPRKLEISAHDDLEAPLSMSSDGRCGVVEVVPRPLPLPYTRREKAPVVSVELPLEEPLVLGMGIDAADAVKVEDLACRLTAGVDRVRIHLKRRAAEEAATLRWRLDQGEWSSRETDLSAAVFSSVELPVGELRPGMHTLEVRIDCSGAEGPVRRVLVSRGPLEGTQTWSCPRGSVAETSTLRLELRPQGGRALLYRLGLDGAKGAGGFRILAGPPMFGGDLSSQRYEVGLADGDLTACCDWVSRPGLRYCVRYGLDACGLVRGSAEIENDSGAPEEAFFTAMGWEGQGWPGDVLLPSGDDMVRSEQIFQLFPDQDSDLPREMSELPFPVMGGYGEAAGSGILACFEGWQLLRSGCPRSKKYLVRPGEKVRSPDLERLVASASPGSLLDAGAAVGWDVDRPGRYLVFPDIDCPPLLPAGSRVSLSNPLRAKRAARIEVDGNPVAEGEVGPGESIEAGVEAGPHSLAFAASGVQRNRSVLAVEPGRVETGREGDDLRLSGSGLQIAVDPGARGHVHSIRYAGREWAFSSHPEPAAFAWFSPWFGGIVPWVSPGGLMGRIAHLEELEVDVTEAEQELWGFTIPSARMCWKLDHEDWMSVGIQWTVGILPGFPAVVADLIVEPLAGSRRDITAMICGFVAPGGDREGSVLELHSRRGLTLRRDTSGAFLLGGRLASVTGSEGHRLWTGAGESSVLFVEDYASQGAFVCAMGVPESRDGSLQTTGIWLLEDDGRNSALRDALLSWNRSRPPVTLF
jgi:ribosomal protein S18 acetylase RimI-like enzyme